MERNYMNPKTGSIGTKDDWDYEAGYFAYYRPQHAQKPLTKAIQPWGKSCFYDSMGRSVVYGTLEEAQKACEKHLEKEDARK